jgi:hypothetical protein
MEDNKVLAAVIPSRACCEIMKVTMDIIQCVLMSCYIEKIKTQKIQKYKNFDIAEPLNLIL